jgi:murein DD-endopeptidase MepM/ murein hydrolase activator NlpD
MSADEYNKAEIISGRLTYSEITALVKFFQEAKGLDADGKAGPVTQLEIDKLLGPATNPPTLALALPLPTLLASGRRPIITSEFRPPDRPKHNGVDLFYHWQPGDRPDFIGDKGAAGKNADGSPKFVVPYGVFAIAAQDGIVQVAGNSTTGYRLWIDHGNGLRTGYFHLLDLHVSVGERVSVGQELGLVGDNPADNDGRHLHFELSPVDRYAPMDPAPYLS